MTSEGAAAHSTAKRELEPGGRGAISTRRKPPWKLKVGEKQNKTCFYGGERGRRETHGGRRGKDGVRGEGDRVDLFPFPSFSFFRVFPITGVNDTAGQLDAVPMKKDETLRLQPSRDLKVLARPVCLLICPRSSVERLMNITTTWRFTTKFNQPTTGHPKCKDKRAGSSATTRKEGSLGGLLGTCCSSFVPADRALGRP